MASISDRNIMREPLLDTSSSKGGFRTLPFIIANEAFEKVATYGLLPNMILYLMEAYGLDLATGSNFIYFYSAATNFTPVIGAFFADFCVGRFWMIAVGSIISVLGMILLWLTTIIPGARPCDESGSGCMNPNLFQLTFLVSSLGLLSIGAGGIRSSSLAFGADQLMNGESQKSAGILERFFNWYYVVASTSVVVALTCLVYTQDHFGWKIGFGVPVMLMFLSALSFFVASSFYVRVKAEASSLTSFAKVLVASWKKRHLNLSERADRLYCYRRRSKLIKPSDRMRFLSKACIVENAKEELAPDGTALNPWHLCTVDQVEEVKALIGVIPIWSTGIMVSVASSQLTFPTVQAGTMDRHITSNFEVPAGSFSTFTIFFLVLWIMLYDRVIVPSVSKITGKRVQLSVRTRMGIGLFLAPLSLVASAIIEGVRRKIAIDEGFSENPKGIVHMSAFWLLWHHSIFGISEALVGVGQNEFFYLELPNSMGSVATNLYGVGMCLANLISSFIMSSIDSITSRDGNESWVSSNINKAHFDYYYWILTVLGFLNFFYYLICVKAYDPPQEKERIVAGDGVEYISIE